jgi:predicted RNA binding protein YcfA (HicA-like mRNA interferase family)
MKCSELLRILKKGSHLKLAHLNKANKIIFPDHGSQEIGKGLEMRILKDTGLK